MKDINNNYTPELTDSIWIKDDNNIYQKGVITSMSVDRIDTEGHRICIRRLGKTYCGYSDNSTQCRVVIIEKIEKK